jgi:hypothetical protein
VHRERMGVFLGKGLLRLLPVKGFLAIWLPRMLGGASQV